MTQRRSVTRWIEDLKRGDEEAARKLWERYFQKMVQASQNKLKRQRRAADEEDAAISAFGSLCRGAAQGRFSRLDDRGDLWALLLTLTAQKAIDVIRRESRQRRGRGKVRGESIFDGTEGAAGLDHFANQEPTPEFLALVDEQYVRLMERLGDDTLCRIVQWKMEGHGNEDIAQLLGVSLRTVGRKLGMVRTIWAQELQV